MDALCPPLPPDLIVFDFDGVFTDNTVFVDQNGIESVRCSRADGLGLDMMRQKGVPMCILSTEKNPVVAARAAKLQMQVFHGCGNKKVFLADHMQRNGIDPDRVIYIGDDVNDYEAMLLVAFRVCPANAHPNIKKIAHLVLNREGGNGAVREMCDYFLSLQW